jgi:hypothetical protein
MISFGAYYRRNDVFYDHLLLPTRMRVMEKLHILDRLNYIPSWSLSPFLKQHEIKGSERRCRQHQRPVWRKRLVTKT